MLVVGPRNLNSSTVSNIDDGNYHHIAGTYDGSTMVIYVDGIKRGYSNIALATQSTPFYIGHHQHWQVSDASGVIISDLRVSDIVRYTSDFTAPQRLPSTVALSSDNKVYGYANGTFSKLSDNWATITDKEKITLFTNTNGKQPTIADLQTIGTSCSLMAYTDDDNRQDCKLRALPNAQFIKPKNLINLHAYESITNMSVTSDISTNATLRILVTTDLATYKYFDTASSTWKAVDITDINNVKQYGMSASVMKALMESMSAGGLNVAEEDVYARASATATPTTAEAKTKKKTCNSSYSFMTAVENDYRSRNGLAEYQTDRNMDELRSSCVRNTYYLNADDDMVLFPEFKWDVPQKRPPACVGGGASVQPMAEQTALIGTLLSDAENTRVGSMLPNFVYKELPPQQ